MKVKSKRSVKEKQLQCDIQTAEENFFVHTNTGKILVHNSPSLVLSKSKEKGFFVASKSAFAKTPKLNYTEADIEINHANSPGLQEKLTYALRYLKDVPFEGTYQGDFLYTKPDLKIKKGLSQDDRDQVFVTFHPNTIIYAFPLDSETGQEVKNSQMGIAVHTKYEGPEAQQASFNWDYAEIPSTKDVRVFTPEIPSVAGSVTLTAEETQEAARVLEDLPRLLPSEAELDVLLSDENLSVILSTYKNATIREDDNTSFEGLLSFFDMKYEKALESRKSEKGKERIRNNFEAMRSQLLDSRNTIEEIYRWQNNVTSLKTLLVNKLNNVSSFPKYIEFRNGEIEATGEEGFVVNDSYGNVVKFVDRLTFAKSNFSPDVVKGWEH